MQSYAQSEQKMYDFKANPQAVMQKKYRDAENDENQSPSSSHNPALNLMFDKRVVRGNTYAAIVMQSRNVDPMLNKQDKKAFSKQGKQRQDEQQKINVQNIRTDYRVAQKDSEFQGCQTPPPVQNRHHIHVQTDEYVEVLTDHLPANDNEVQTDFYIDRPNNRLFISSKIGEDASTQIEKNELFDFDEESEPVVQVLLGKTLEQARMEVLEEDELKRMKLQKETFEQQLDAEKMEVQRLEAFERRQAEEMEHRRLQHRTQRIQKVQCHKKLVSRGIAKQAIKAIRLQTLSILEELQLFRPPLTTALYDQFLPWLYSEVNSVLKTTDSLDTQVEQIGQAVAQQNSHDMHKHSLVKRGLDIQAKRDAEEQLRLYRIEQKRLRKIEKERQNEIDRRDVLFTNIMSRIVKKAVVKENYLTDVLADINGAGQNTTPFIGLFGGVITQLTVFLQTLKRVAFQREDVLILRDIFDPPVKAVHGQQQHQSQKQNLEHQKEHHEQIQQQEKEGEGQEQQPQIEHDIQMQQQQQLQQQQQEVQKKKFQITDRLIRLIETFLDVCLSQGGKIALNLSEKVNGELRFLQKKLLEEDPICQKEGLTIIVSSIHTLPKRLHEQVIAVLLKYINSYTLLSLGPESGLLDEEFFAVIAKITLQYAFKNAESNGKNITFSTLKIPRREQQFIEQEEEDEQQQQLKKGSIDLLGSTEQHLQLQEEKVNESQNEEESETEQKEKKEQGKDDGGVVYDSKMASQQSIIAIVEPHSYAANFDALIQFSPFQEHLQKEEEEEEEEENNENQQKKDQKRLMPGLINVEKRIKFSQQSNAKFLNQVTPVPPHTSVGPIKLLAQHCAVEAQLRLLMMKKVLDLHSIQQQQIINANIQEEILQSVNATAINIENKAYLTFFKQDKINVPVFGLDQY